jgi:methyl-accepting chemotaxis protein
MLQSFLETRGLSARMMVGFVIASAITLVVGLCGIWTVQRGGAITARLYEEDFQSVLQLKETEVQLLVALGGQKNSLVAFTPEQRNAHIRAMSEAHAKIDASVNGLKKGAGSAEKAAMIQSLSRHWERLRAANEAVIEKLKKDEAEEAFKLSNGSATEAFNSTRNTLSSLVQNQSASANQSFTASQDGVSNARYLLIGLSILSAGLAIAVGLFTMKKVLLKIVGSVQQVALLADRLSESAIESREVSSKLSSAASRQATSLEQTSSSSDQVNSFTQKNASGSLSAVTITLRMNQKIRDTGKTLEEMKTSMGEIQSSSNNISKIIKVIDEIAFQTNILALNAAVEAARAGEAGMGFSVVAEEVRNLAHRSAKAAKETADLIAGSIDKTKSGSTHMDSMAKEFTAINEDSSQVESLLQSMSDALRQQSHGIQTIAQSLADIALTTQQTAVSAESGVRTSNDLQTEAQELANTVNELRAVVGSAHF